MNKAQALEVIKNSKPDKVQKAIQIVRTHLDCFGMYNKQGACINITGSQTCIACEKYTKKLESVKEERHAGRKSGKDKKAGSNKKAKRK